MALLPITAKARITSKGQVTIPKAIRDSMGLKAGQQVEFRKDKDGVHVKRVVDPKVFDKWMGYLKHLEGQDVDELIREMRGDDYRD